MLVKCHQLRCSLTDECIYLEYLYKIQIYNYICVYINNGTLFSYKYKMNYDICMKTNRTEIILLSEIKQIQKDK